MPTSRERVYSFVKKIPKGKISTYGIVARIANTSPRAVGSILHTNDRKDVPCQRVVMSDGSIGGFARGVKNKIKILRSEGVEVKNGKINLKKFLFIP